MSIQLESVVAELAKVARKAGPASMAVREALLAEAKRGEAYAKTIAPVNKTGKPHQVSAGHIDEPGDYRDSIEGTVLFVRGEWVGRVVAKDWKAHMIEYGTAKMPKFATMRRTAGYLKATKA